MKYYEIDMDGYILCVYIGKDGEHEITRERYVQIQNIMSLAPEIEEGYGCRLRLDLVWEIFQIEDEAHEEA